MKLFGMDAINYVKRQGGQLNRFPDTDSTPGVKYGISIEEAEQVVLSRPYNIWTEKEVIKNGN